MTDTRITHLWITAPTREQRERLVAGLDLPPLLAHVDAHRRLRGPYTAAGSLVRTVAGDALERRPDLLTRHDIEVLTVAPELRGSVPCERETLTSIAAPEERTRYYPPSRTRRIAHGVLELLRELQSADAQGPRSVIIEHAGDADATDLEWMTILLRRLDPARLRVVVCTAGEVADAALGGALARHATRIAADGAPAAEPADLAELAARFVASDCTSDDSRLRTAYECLPVARRAALHDERAEELEQRDELSLRLGAIPFHRERGADPRGAGAKALLAALEHCMLMGFYDAVIDLARRSHAVLDWTTRPEDCWLVTAKITLALAALGRPDEALALYEDACAQSSLPKVHLRAAYGRAMLYTRYYKGERRDRAKAKAWINAAIALSSLSPDPRQRIFNLTFNENALALIEMHLGDARKALELVTRNLERLEEEVDPDGQVLHRSVLLYNRAQLLDRFGTPEEALAEYSTVIEADPHQSEYYLQRAAVHRRLGNVSEAFADYAQAIRLSPPYPEPHQQRAELALAVGDVDTAIADLSYVLELDPECIEARVTRASLLLELGDAAAARRDAEAGLAVDPAQAELQLVRAMVAQQEGRVEEAHAAFDAALRGDPTLAAGWSNRAVLWFEQGEVERAIEDLTRALELEDDPDIRANRALAYEAAGRASEAAADRELVAAASAAA